MNRDEWKEIITENCKNVGTYRAEFLPVIDTLSCILEKRDTAEAQYVAEGSEPVIDHTIRGGYGTRVKNPLLLTIGELNTQALAYWRDLGLTPAGLRKLNEQAFQKKKTSALAEVLKELG